MSRILNLLKLTPSTQSIDYVENKTQFHLFNLLTEQRHGLTQNLSFSIRGDTEAGIRMLLAVDQDIARKLAQLIQSPALLEQAVSAVVEAIQADRKIYVYGCGAAGRVAKQMESTLWRPFWQKIRRSPCWAKLQRELSDDIENSLIGEMTGADRALVSSLEGFEDLPLIGKLQLQDHRIGPGDVVICITEGGETSSVIGAIQAAVNLYGESDSTRARRTARAHLFFIYNNPDELLRPLRRSTSVLDNPAITKINLTTGPQAITGSTRMQATTIDTFVVGAVLEEGIARILRPHLSDEEFSKLGFNPDIGLRGRLSDFDRIKVVVDTAAPAVAGFTEMEGHCYSHHGFATYFAKSALITVFIDSAERSPTFRLHPLDTVEDRERKCWVQVWTEARDSAEAWRNLLGRPFRGLDVSLYRTPLEQEAIDPYLRDAALRSLSGAGNDQALSYDFSFSEPNIGRRGPRSGDVGVLVLLDDEVLDLERSESDVRRFMALFRQQSARLCFVIVTGPQLSGAVDRLRRVLGEGDLVVPLVLNVQDPLSLRRQIALKMLLNAHSTGIMAALGRVIGNTMTSVSPSNLKLVGRATYLVMSHVNDVLEHATWRRHEPEQVTFAEANAVLMEAMDYAGARAIAETSEVALAIIRIIESLRRDSAVSWDEARAILDQEGLAAYLLKHNPVLV